MAISQSQTSQTSQTSQKSENKVWELCGMIILICGFGLFGIIIYNWIYTIVSVISFTNKDVENICPDSELWWWALFIGIIWPFLLSNNAKNTIADREKNTELPFILVIGWIIMLTSFIVWAWDQLWGVPGFANDTCAMNHWETYNTTKGAENDGHRLFTAVEWWMYIFMIIDAVFILAVFGVGGIIIVESKKQQNTSNPTLSSV